jgi:hypothetical protein
MAQCMILEVTTLYLSAMNRLKIIPARLRPSCDMTKDGCTKMQGYVDCDLPSGATNRIYTLLSQPRLRYGREILECNGDGLFQRCKHSPRLLRSCVPSRGVHVQIERGGTVDKTHRAQSCP